MHDLADSCLHPTDALVMQTQHARSVLRIFARARSMGLRTAEAATIMTAVASVVHHGFSRIWGRDGYLKVTRKSITTHKRALAH